MAFDEDGTAALRPLLDVLDRVLSKGIVISYGDARAPVAQTDLTYDLPLPETTEAQIRAADEFLSRLPSDGAPHLRQLS